MNRTLFELGDEIMQLDALLYTVEDGDEGMRSMIEGYVGTLEENLKEKLDNYAAFITELEERSSGRRAEAERLMNRSRADANKAARLKEVLRWFFQTHDVKSVETPRYRVTLAANGGELPLMVNPDLLTQDFLVEIVSHMPDADKIREALDNGVEVPGAMYGERGSSIRIK